MQYYFLKYTVDRKSLFVINLSYRKKRTDNMKSHKNNIAENIKWIKDFSLKIGFFEEDINEIIIFYEAEYRHINRLSKKRFTLTSSSQLLLREKLLKKDRAYICILTAVILKARDTLNIYREKNISDEIFYSTMTDIKIWSENFRNKKGFTGLDELSWIQNHLNCKIFRLGRLQFQPFPFYLPPYVSKEKGKTADIKIGEKVLNVHIPQGEKLLKEECEKSLAMAESFFRDYPYKAFICDSWLLCERNSEFMSENSNIISFAEMFEILGSSDNPSQTVERVFGKIEKDPADYPENTALQRQCKAYILSGGKPGTGFGIIRAKK